MRPTAEIAGAGLAGLACAAALALRGWRVRVHETAAAARDGGAGIYVFPFAQAVLREVGAFDAFARDAFSPAERAVYIDGRCTSVSDVRGTFLTTTRSSLHAALLDAAQQAGAEIVCGARAVGATPDGTLIMETGARFKADLVVGADGVRASIAEALGLPLLRKRHQDGITRVLLDRSGMRGGEWDRVIDAYDYRGRPLRVLYTPCGRDAFYFCLMAPASDQVATALPVARDLWVESFPWLADALTRIGVAGRHDRYTTTTLGRWYEGRVAIVGDAAHAMPSSLAQGAGVSMMNAVAMADAVDRAGDVAAGLAEWELDMRPVVEAWQKQAETVAYERNLATARHPGFDLDSEKPTAAVAIAAAAAS